MKTNFKVPATLICDCYKISHRSQYPTKTEKVYSTWIPRTSRITFVDKVVAFGFQAFIKKYLIEYFNDNFFSRPLKDVVDEYSRVVKYCLGDNNPDTSHIEALHSLGYLPILIKAVPEGTLVPVRVPTLTIENTHEDFGWLTNYLETIASCELWQSATSATLALEYRKILDKYSAMTSDIPEFVDFQGHDFSMRGMSSLESAITSGMGHLLSFAGTDTIPAILGLENYYNANIENELVGCSVPATEHSIASCGGSSSLEEEATFRRLITEVHPSGTVSLVSDTWDLWNVLTNILPNLKEVINARDGKVVIRPDSGDPVDIICGVPYSEVFDLDDYSLMSSSDSVVKNLEDGKFYKVTSYDTGWTTKFECKEISEASVKGVIELLYETFGGTLNSKGFIQLSDKVGAIYGDSITLERAENICKRLMDKGFASTNIVLGIGSYTYQYNTRDTFGFAMKATHCVINGVEKNIFKDPITDDGTKKSLTGRCVVQNIDGTLVSTDGLSELEEYSVLDNVLQPIFCDGVLLVETSLKEIRERIKQ
jgi:nicotinamide phosphoribosyltransferase